MAGHPLIALVVGRAVSGVFLELAGQANRLIAFNDPKVLIHAMYKEAAARITRRSVAELEKLGRKILPLAYDVESFARLGAVHNLLDVANPDEPSPGTIDQVKSALLEAIVDARRSPPDLSSRLESAGAKKYRQASLAVRQKMSEQWYAS
jgi:biotin-independent malonate decarboxylase gamma subunit